MVADQLDTYGGCSNYLCVCKQALDDVVVVSISVADCWLCYATTKLDKSALTLATVVVELEAIASVGLVRSSSVSDSFKRQPPGY